VKFRKLLINYQTKESHHSLTARDNMKWEIFMRLIVHTSALTPLTPPPTPRNPQNSISSPLALGQRAENKNKHGLCENMGGGGITGFRGMMGDGLRGKQRIHIKFAAHHQLQV